MLILYRLVIPYGMGMWLFVLFAVLTGLRLIKVSINVHKPKQSP